MIRILGAAVYLICAMGAAHAEGRFPGGGAFKGIAPPAPNATGRIGIHIGSESGNVAVPAIAGDASKPTNIASWFWNNVSPEISQTSSARLEYAVAQLSKAPSGAVTEPRLQMLKDLATAYNTDILLATIGTSVSPALVLSIMSVESGGRVDVESSAGAVGLMQLMPATAERFGVADRTDPSDNIAGGVRFLDMLMDDFSRDPILVLAAYNAGEGAVRTHEGVPDYAETRAYVPKVLAAWKVARILCKTPPELISDGCVFALD